MKTERKIIEKIMQENEVVISVLKNYNSTQENNSKKLVTIADALEQV
jgi:hypothetical protein